MAPRPRQFRETATPSARSPAGRSPRRPLEGDLAGKVQVLASDPKDGLAPPWRGSGDFMDAPPWGVLTAAAGATKNFASRSLAVIDDRTPRGSFGNRL